MNSLDEQKKRNILCIYGAGAVGLAVAADALAASRSPAPQAPLKDAQELDLIYINATNKLTTFELKSPVTGFHFESPMRSHQPRDLEHLLSGHLLGTPLIGALGTIKEACRILFIVATPPQHMDESVNHILDWVTTNKDTVAQRHLRMQLLVLCNGLLEPQTWERAASTSSVIPNFSTIRCIVVAGFVRELVEGGARAIVTHTSGREIYWGEILATPPNGQGDDGTAAEILAPALHGPLFTLLPEQNMRNLELQKFFTNAVLGWWIGNNAATNGSLPAVLQKVQAFRLAQEFCSAFYCKGSEASLCNFLWHTVSTTASNVNSVSAAWCRGNRGLADYFRDTIKKRLQDASGSLAGRGSCWLNQFDAMG